MTLTRRGFLQGLAPASAVPWLAAALPGCSGGRDETFLNGATRALAKPPEPWPAPAAAEESPFQHGVASGDPLPDAVILWTRVTLPEALRSQGLDTVEVQWRIALDPQLEQLVGEGTTAAEASSDHTLHVEPGGLASDTTYYYQFRTRFAPDAAWQSSPRGRTKTLPAGVVARMRFAVVSCSNYPAGFFNVYGLLAQSDVDLVLHLGDYIYEYQDLALGDGAEIGRAPDPAHELLSLDDYRRRYAQYKTDPDLQELHRQHPFVAIWDDHEVANDTWRDGAQNHQSDEGDFAARKRAALQAYREWLPLRPSPTPELLYRSFSCGDLLDLVVIDTRNLGRDQQVGACDVSGLADPQRGLLGATQEAWLSAQLAASQARGARWRLLGQQVIFAPRARSASGCVHSADAWDGYQAARARVLDALEQGGIDNLVVLTGDAHSSWAFDVPRDPFAPGGYDPETGRGSLLVELVTPAVSSPAAGAGEQALRAAHPHLKFTDQSRQGYVLLDVTPERVLGEWHLVPTVRERSAQVALAAVLQTLTGQRHLVPGEASLARAALPEPAR